jgi:GNAT superfamily N-acetyltransferase
MRVITRCYDRFTEIDKAVRYDLLTKLCFKIDSRMPETALKHNPPCVVAFEGKEPVGWAMAASTAPGKPYLLMTFVHPAYRRRGIGTGLVLPLLHHCGELRLPANRSPGAKKFHASIPRLR